MICCASEHGLASENADSVLTVLLNNDNTLCFKKSSPQAMSFIITM